MWPQSVSDIVRGMGVAVMCSTCGGAPPAGQVHVLVALKIPLEKVAFAHTGMEIFSEAVVHVDLGMYLDEIRAAQEFELVEHHAQLRALPFARAKIM